MRAVIQRVKYATVSIDDNVKAKIGNGLFILLGIEEADTEVDLNWLCNKIIQMRVFNDNNCKMNLSLLDVHADILLVSQFTLFASTKKGNRLSFLRAAKPNIAIPLYNRCILVFETLLNKKIATGEFGADMQIDLLNDGPVTIIIDSKNME
jgi:D-tyrosyl-tRNA(Tyr) deacylase